MYVARDLTLALKEAMDRFPAVFLTGPRQAGKTTLQKHVLKGKADYVSFDDPMERSFAVNDPRGFLDGLKRDTAILDEIQYVPELMQYLKIHIDENRQRMGRWLLTGSQHFQLMKGISESLAGRIAILELLPFSITEKGGKRGEPLETAVWNGGYPEPSLYPEKRDLWIRSYIQTYIERDVRHLVNVKDLRVFEHFLGLSAAHHGQVFNSAALSREIGVSLPTIKSWAGVLEASYVCAYLSPYFRNYGKRLVKSPKMYFLDPAVVCTMTKQPDGKSALSGAMGGSLFEGLIVSEAIKGFSNKGKQPDLFFWRSHDGLEVDLIIRIGAQLYPVEIKLTSSPTLRHLDPLNRFRALAKDDAADTGLIVCRVEKRTRMPNNNLALPWSGFPDWLNAKLAAVSV